MPTEVFEDVLELEIELLEAVMPTLDRPVCAYPLPDLSKTGSRDVRPFHTVILENEFLRLTLLPELGGRIWSVYDKRSGSELLPGTSRVDVVDGGLRGVVCDAGIQVVVDGSDRPNALGQVLYQVIPAFDEESSAGVRFSDHLTCSPLSIDWTVGLAPDSATIEFEVRIHNRSIAESQACNPGVILGGQTIAPKVVEHPGRSLFVISSEEHALPYLAEGGWQRSTSAIDLGPRQLDSFRFCITPYAAIDGFAAANESFACGLTPSRLVVQSSSRRRGHRVLLLTQAGQTMEATVDLHPENPLDMKLEGPVAGAVSVAILDSDRTVLLNTQVEDHPFPADNFVASPVLQASTIEELWLATRRAETRGQAYYRLAIESIKAGDFARADAFLETVLLYNGDDPLVWWLKSAVCRLKGAELEDRPELLNAHFLAPLEPILRAESFLSEPNDGSADPHPLLTPLDGQPELFVEAACLLIECGLWEQAARFLDEVIRHGELGMLHVLMSYALLESSRMEMEAARHAEIAASHASNPPYPFRSVELAALRCVNERFGLRPLVELEQIALAHVPKSP